MLTLTKLLHDLDNIHPSAGAEDPIHAWYLAGYFCPIPLGEASGSDEQLIRAFGFCQGVQHRNTILRVPGR